MLWQEAQKVDHLDGAFFIQPNMLSYWEDCMTSDILATVSIALLVLSTTHGLPHLCSTAQIQIQIRSIHRQASGESLRSKVIPGSVKLQSSELVW